MFEQHFSNCPRPRASTVDSFSERHRSSGGPHDSSVVKVRDGFPSVASQLQRDNRSGRTEKGMAITFGDLCDSEAPRMDSDTVMRALCYTAGKAMNRFAKLTLANTKHYMHRIETLFADQTLAKAAACFPFSLDMGALFQAGQELGVGQALSALLLAIDNGVCKRSADVMQVIRSVQDDAPISEKTDIVSLRNTHRLYQHQSLAKHRT